MRDRRLAMGRLASATLIWLAAAGCSAPPEFEFDKLDLVPTQENLTEYPLGNYTIPIPIVEDQGQNQRRHRNRIQFQFELYALVTPEEKWQIADAWKRHEGTIRDRVIRVCRNATVDELQEPELATLKSHLLDALEVQLGEKDVRQLLITEIVSTEI